MDSTEDSATSLNVFRRLRPKTRFRAIVRRVMASSWLISSWRHTTKKMKQNSLELDFRIKSLLTKRPEYRTDEEREMIYNAINKFKCFRKYSAGVKQLMIEYIQLVCYEAKRTIVRTNNYATAIFFLISGQLDLIGERYDPFLDETEYIIEDTLVPGDVVGELCLLHDLPRMETITSHTPVELLMLKKKYYDMVLKDYLREDFEAIAKEMAKFTIFDDWDMFRIGDCCMQSSLAEFKRGDIVLGDGYGRPNYVHFILEGRCSLVEHIYTNKTSSRSSSRPSSAHFASRSIQNYNRESKYFSLNDNSITSSIAKETTVQQAAKSMFELAAAKRTTFRRSYVSINSESKSSADDITPTTEIIFMKICTYDKMCCFSVGEPMTHRRVVADVDCVCLLIPVVLLMNYSSAWFHIKTYLLKHIPDSPTVYKECMRMRQWRRYRHKLVEPELVKYGPNAPSNIPYSIRIHQDFNYKPMPTDPCSRKEIQEYLYSQDNVIKSRN